MNSINLHRPINILLADDGSEHALSAINLIRDLPLPKQSRVLAMGVLIPRESSNHAILSEVLDQSKAFLEDKGIKTDTELVLGYPQEILIEYAEKYNPDLIVVGAKGLRATLGILLGGVAQQVVEYAHCPVLVVRAPYTGLNRITIVTDGSIHSQKAAEYISGKPEASGDFQCHQFPLPLDTEISIVHVLPPLPSPEIIARSWPLGPEMLPSYTPEPAAESDWLDRETPIGQAILDRSIESFCSCGIDAKSELLMGDAATEIIEFTKVNSIDLVVSGSRGLSQTKGWLLGSVSRKLVHYAGCSVLIVKGRSEEN